MEVDHDDFPIITPTVDVELEQTTRESERARETLLFLLSEALM